MEGWALAGGCEMALACDLIVAAGDARFGIPEVKRGLVAAAGGLIRLPRRIPAGIAMELALTGDPLPAADAHRLGLVNALTPPGGALDGARALQEPITRPVFGSEDAREGARAFAEKRPPVWTGR